jgi:hypothetical protein
LKAGSALALIVERFVALRIHQGDTAVYPALRLVSSFSIHSPFQPEDCAG